MVKKVEEKKVLWKGKTEEERQESMIIWTTLNSIRARFGKDMIQSELNTIQIVMEERLNIGEEEEPPAD
jgi:NADH dehydrogenase FAD-containing subunit